MYINWAKYNYVGRVELDVKLALFDFLLFLPTPLYAKNIGFRNKIRSTNTNKLQ